jgi:flagellar motor switch protein FliG
MGCGKNIVITAYGHDKIIDKIAASSFDCSDHPDGYRDDSNAETYRDTINSLELSGDSWVFAKIVSENIQYSLDVFLPFKFDMFLKLDDRAIQKILREADSRDIAIALKDGNENIQERIFSNMSKRAARMIKEDMEYMGPVRLKDVRKSQEKIINIIRRLEEFGEIVILYSKGETTE